MARIPSPNPDFSPNPQVPGPPAYTHPVDVRPLSSSSTTATLGNLNSQAATNTRPIPVAFQVSSPFNRRMALMPHALVMHVNPSSLSESHNQKVERFQTRGGYVEQHWGHELVEVSADGSTGAFMNIRTGLTSVLRQRTIAWDRFRDLHDLFRNNGAVHDPNGAVVLQGNIILMYDRGVFIGGFRSFEWEETEDSPFAFKVSWSFKIEQTISMIDTSQSGFNSGFTSPSFQSQNTAAQAGTGSSASSASAATLNAASSFSPDFVLSNNQNTNR